MEKLEWNYNRYFNEIVDNFYNFRFGICDCNYREIEFENGLKYSYVKIESLNKINGIR